MQHETEPGRARGGAVSPGGAMRLPWRNYWLAGVLAVAGLAITGVSGWQIERWAVARDAEQFAAEARLIVQLIEQKMERYESALSRLRDACARNHGEISFQDWGGWLGNTLGMTANYPNVRLVVVAPKITREQRAAFEQRARVQVGNHPGTIITSRSDADSWFPVWRRTAGTWPGDPALGDDLLAETPQHPSFEKALSATVGWVGSRPAQRIPADGNVQVGFWYVMPLRPLEFTNQIQWKSSGETEEQAARRRDEELARQATGLLAAFIGGELFLNDFNEATAKVRVQLFTSETLVADNLLNPGHALPLKPRHTQDAAMRWYGKTWTARLASTPGFEAGSLQYRAWLVWGMGAVLSLGAAAAVAWQTRGRWREAALAAQLREALARQERLSRDLHDGTLQSVYGIGLALQRAQRLFDKRPADAAKQVAETTVALQQVIGEMRDFIRETDPATREEIPLGEALAGVVSHLKLGTEIELHLEVQPNADRGLTPAQSLQLLNIAREALSNCVRHSRARRVQIKLEQSSGVIRLEVADDGCGFDATAAPREGRGLGNLAARVRELGGKHHWETAAGQGARLMVEVPLPLTSTKAVS